jgi:hypothetical protein
MSVLVEITLNDKNDKLNDATINLEFLFLEGQQLNNELKPKELARQERDDLTVEKAGKEKQVQQNQLEKKVKELRKAHMDAKKMEVKVRKQGSRASNKRLYKS